MFEIAQDMLRTLQERVRTTLRVVADLAESFGVPPTVTSLLASRERADTASTGDTWSSYSYRSATPAPVVEAEPATVAEEEQPPAVAEPDCVPAPERRRAVGKKRGLVGAVDLSDSVRPLEVDDEIQGSTYLARIIWCLGVAELEGSGALRPADMARMIMSRSPVSLEPPNVARYIRRSKPTCIAVSHTEGGSSFYQLNDEGRAIFGEKYSIKK